MSRWQDQPRNRHESVTIRTIWLTLALSILIHVAALFVLIPHMRTMSDELEQGEASAPVQVRLAPPPSTVATTPPEPSRDTQASITPPVRPPKVATRPPPKQAMVVPSTETPAVALPPPSPPPPPPVVREAARPDRWQLMNEAIARCPRDDISSRVSCEQRLRAQYCEGHWGQVAQCASIPYSDHGQ